MVRLCARFGVTAPNIRIRVIYYDFSALLLGGGNVGGAGLLCLVVALGVIVCWRGLGGGLSEFSTPLDVPDAFDDAIPGPDELVVEVDCRADVGDDEFDCVADVEWFGRAGGVNPAVFL